MDKSRITFAYMSTEDSRGATNDDDDEPAGSGEKTERGAHEE